MVEAGVLEGSLGFLSLEEKEYACRFREQIPGRYGGLELRIGHRRKSLRAWAGRNFPLFPHFNSILIQTIELVAQIPIP
jgi:hypothetical protein